MGGADRGYLTDSDGGADCLGDLLWRGEVQTIIEVIELVGHAAVNIVRPENDSIIAIIQKISV